MADRFGFVVAPTIESNQVKMRTPHLYKDGLLIYPFGFYVVPDATASARPAFIQDRITDIAGESSGFNAISMFVRPGDGTGDDDTATLAATETNGLINFQGLLSNQNNQSASPTNETVIGTTWANRTDIFTGNADDLTNVSEAWTTQDWTDLVDACHDGGYLAYGSGGAGSTADYTDYFGVGGDIYAVQAYVSDSAGYPGFVTDHLYGLELQMTANSEEAALLHNLECFTEGAYTTTVARMDSYFWQSVIMQVQGQLIYTWYDSLFDMDDESALLTNLNTLKSTFDTYSDFFFFGDYVDFPRRRDNDDGGLSHQYAGGWELNDELLYVVVSGDPVGSKNIRQTVAGSDTGKDQVPVGYDTMTHMAGDSFVTFDSGTREIDGSIPILEWEIVKFTQSA